MTNWEKESLAREARYNTQKAVKAGLDLNGQYRNRPNSAPASAAQSRLNEANANLDRLKIYSSLYDDDEE